MKYLLAALFFCSLSSCALVTTPVKIVGAVASSAVNVTGKVVGAGVSHLGRKDKPEEKEE